MKTKQFATSSNASSWRQDVCSLNSAKLADAQFEAPEKGRIKLNLFAKLNKSKKKEKEKKKTEAKKSRKGRVSYNCVT